MIKGLKDCPEVVLIKGLEFDNDDEFMDWHEVDRIKGLRISMKTNINGVQNRSGAI